MDKQTSHKIGLGISLVALTMFVFFGKGVVLYGALMGVGMFATLFLVAIKTPWMLTWCSNHVTATEILSTLGTFFLFNFFGGGTVTAGIASAVVCLLTSAVLGFSKLGFLDRWVGTSYEASKSGLASLKDMVTEEDENAGDEPVKRKRIRIRKPDPVKSAMASAIIASVQGSQN